MARKAQDPHERDRKRMQREIARQLNHWTPRRITAWVLFVLAIVIAIQHVLAHAGWRPLPFGMGVQDIFVGYPTALVLGIAGGIVLGAPPKK